MSVKYLVEHFQDVTFSRKNVTRKGILQLAPGQGADGYGKKISTDYVAHFDGREHRVYCICFSNSGSLYVLVKKEMFFVRDFDIPESARKEQT